MKNRRKFRELSLDPRTKLILLAFANIVAFTQKSLIIEISWVAVLLLLIVFCGCYGPAVKWAVLFSLCLLMQYYIFPNGPKVLTSAFFIIVTYARKIFPCLIVGTLLIKKTSVRHIMLALRRWHIPQGLIIPLSVTLRYFPALKEEMGYISDAMKLRHIHGIKKLECVVVPMMISATNTAEELSAAAVTRGIENPKPKTSIVTMHFGFQDIVCILAGIIFTAASICVQ